jgi:hypothetical protein
MEEPQQQPIPPVVIQQGWVEKIQAQLGTIGPFVGNVTDFIISFNQIVSGTSKLNQLLIDVTNNCTPETITNAMRVLRDEHHCMCTVDVTNIEKAKSYLSEKISSVQRDMVGNAVLFSSLYQSVILAQNLKVLFDAVQQLKQASNLTAASQATLHDSVTPRLEQLRVRSLELQTRVLEIDHKDGRAVQILHEDIDFFKEDLQTIKDQIGTLQVSINNAILQLEGIESKAKSQTLVSGLTFVTDVFQAVFSWNYLSVGTKALQLGVTAAHLGVAVASGIQGWVITPEKLEALRGILRQIDESMAQANYLTQQVNRMRLSLRQ